MSDAIESKNSGSDYPSIGATVRVRSRRTGSEPERMADRSASWVVSRPRPGSLKELVDRSMSEAKDGVDGSLEPCERLPKRKRSATEGL
jgi:hypothetical protein